MEFEDITLNNWPFTVKGIAFGKGTRLQLEVIFSDYAKIPSNSQLRSAWKSRQNRRGVPLLSLIHI